MKNKTEHTESLPESHQALHLRAEPRQIAMNPTLFKEKKTFRGIGTFKGKKL